MSILSNLELDELEVLLEQQGWSKTNSEDLYAQIHRFGAKRVTDLPERRFPKTMLTWLEDQVFQDPATWRTHRSIDGSIKFISQLSDGRQIETLYMPSEKRDTICLSSQAGCAMGCTFCATGKMGLLRNLKPSEIIHQVRAILDSEKMPRNRQRRLNLHFMGMGEPLQNLGNVLKAFRILIDQHGLGIPERDIGISTCGLVPGIRELGRQPNRPFLMVSLAVSDNKKRSKMMPINKKWPLEKLVECLKAYPLRKKERIMLTYVLIQGVNHTPEEADRLASIAKEFPSIVNLIPFNEFDKTTDMIEPEENQIQSFYQRLLDQGIFCTVRRSRGRDIAGACGQLVQMQ